MTAISSFSVGNTELATESAGHYRRRDPANQANADVGVKKAGGREYAYINTSQATREYSHAPIANMSNKLAYVSIRRTGNKKAPLRGGFGIQGRRAYCRVHEVAPFTVRVASIKPLKR
jgi:hypothetical protein